MFITFEGPDGSGKSTQVKQLAEYLEMHGCPVLLTREPGGTTIGEQIRQVVLSKQSQQISRETEALLFSAARAQIVAEVIKPALASGKIVLCDRYSDSTMAYQGYGLGLDLTELQAITRFATSGLVPNLTFYIDVPVSVGIARKQPGQVNRLDEKEIAYHEKVRAGFLKLAKAEPSRWIILDGMQPLDLVQMEIRTRVMRELNMA
jgi:dTMP kinase